jgi:hypothetical protein
VLHAPGVGLEPLIVPQVRPAQRIAQDLVLAVVPDAKRQVPVCRLEGLVWLDVGMRVAVPFGRFAGDEIVLRPFTSQPSCRSKGHVNCWPRPVFAMIRRSQDGIKQQTRRDIRDGDTVYGGPSIGPVIDINPALRLDDEVIPASDWQEPSGRTCDAAVDQPSWNG